MKTKTLEVNIWCNAAYKTKIEVPEDMSLEDAIEYADEHLEEIPIPATGIEWIPGGEELIWEDCRFLNDKEGNQNEKTMEV